MYEQRPYDRREPCVPLARSVCSRSTSIAVVMDLNTIVAVFKITHWLSCCQRAYETTPPDKPDEVL